jgi:hypothetical protein
MNEYATQRRFPRIPSANTVLVRRLQPKEREILSKTRVVGLGGCMFVTDEKLDAGELVEVLIVVSMQVVETRARIVYLIPSDGRFEVGVEFIQIDSEGRALIEGLLEGARETA